MHIKILGCYKHLNVDTKLFVKLNSPCNYNLATITSRVGQYLYTIVFNHIFVFINVYINKVLICTNW